ncbi:MAG: glycosyltransferase family 2 protein [Oceanicaulis sp.]
MSVSVIMVSYRTGPVLFDAIDAVLDAPDVDELVVVNHDNPPADEARLTALAAAEDSVKLVNTRANLGFSRGCNIGAKASTGDYLLFLNPDAMLSPGVAARLVKTHGGLVEPAIVGALIVEADGSEQPGSRRGELSVRAAIQSFLGGPGYRRDHEPMPRDAVPMETISGAALLMSRSGFEALGGFDEGYFLHVEDIDLCKRARSAGGQIMFEPRAAVRHIGSTSAASRLKIERHKAAGLVRYFSRHSGPLGPLKAALAAPVIYTAVYARAMRRFASSRSDARKDA